MKKLLNKFLLLTSVTLAASTAAYTENTVCYKNDWTSPSTIETTPMNGGECQGQYSIKEMKTKGWRILDIKIDSSQNKLNYKYLLTNAEINTSLTTSEDTVSTTQEETKKLSFKAFGLKIDNLKDNKTTIDIGNLIIGQSGIAIHLHDKEKKLIVANAKVISSNENNSIVEFSEFDDLKQDALPLSKRKVAIGDILALNYLYTSSLLIAPTQETFQAVRKNFKFNNFLHSDIFASSLKNEEEPLPSKKTIQDFAIKQNLGTIFIIVDDKVNVIDTKTFTILTTYKINYNDEDSKLPFYTRIEKIEESVFNSLSNISVSDFSIDSLLGNDKTSNNELNYENYYKKLLGL